MNDNQRAVVRNSRAYRAMMARMFRAEMRDMMRMSPALERTPRTPPKTLEILATGARLTETIAHFLRLRKRPQARAICIERLD